MVKNGRLIRLFLVTMCSLFLIIPGLSAEEAEMRTKAFEEFPDALGVFFGPASGMGLSYHLWSPDIPGGGLQVAAGAVYSPEAENSLFWGNILDYTVGFEYQQSVYGEDFANWLAGQLYLWAGISHRGYIEQNSTMVGESTVYSAGPYSPTITIGVGIGVEIILFRHFSFPIEVGYAATYDFSAADFASGLAVSLVPQGGARYRY